MTQTPRLPRLAALLLCAAIVSSTVPAAAGDATADAPPALDVTAPEPDTGSDLPAEMDPVLRADILALRERGAIALQGEIGAELLMLERLQRRADAIREVMERLGTDGLRQFDPELHASLSRSPIFLQQMLEEIRLIRKIEEALAPPPAETAAEPPSTREEATRGVLEDEFEMPPIGFRDDGSSFFETIGNAGAGLEPDPVAPVNLDPDPFLDEDPDLSLPDPESMDVEFIPPAMDDIPIALVEIFGTPGNLRAVIDHGGELMTVTPGVVLANDNEITQVFEDRIRVRRRDSVIEFLLQ